MSNQMSTHIYCLLSKMNIVRGGIPRLVKSMYIHCPVIPGNQQKDTVVKIWHDCANSMSLCCRL